MPCLVQVNTKQANNDFNNENKLIPFEVLNGTQIGFDINQYKGNVNDWKGYINDVSIDYPPVQMTQMISTGTLINYPK